MNWNDVFEYVEGKIFWKLNPGRKVKAGSEAGSIEVRHGYVSVSFMGSRYKAHRIIWEMFNGQIPDGMQIDHINHIRHDNKIENLRLVKKLENDMNRSVYKNSKSGVTGVRYVEKYRNWRSQIKVNGKQISLGSYSDIREAIKARKDAEVKYGFHENHGVNL